VLSRDGDEQGIAPKKDGQKETKERHCKNETTPPGNVKCWKISLLERQASGPGVMYVRLRSNKRYARQLENWL
jgi:hypothetical protein